ncbi:MAG: hypothetical protein K6T74_16890 [Geminicoccaceae bacterium]|nr:hypothetical protein [Geminicoccaceae bacterium]
MRIGPVLIASAGGKGLGVFAAEPLPAGVPLDPQPVFELDAADVEPIERTRFRHHYFAHPERDGVGVIVLGWLTLCNHGRPPTLELDWRRDPATGWWVVARPCRPLEPGEELTIDYNCPLWFEALP